MGDLDDKLKAIIKEEILDPIWEGEGVNAKDYFGIDSDELIKQIKQAFQDDEKTKMLEYMAKGQLMTGQEWYDRFVQVYLAEHTDPKTYAPEKLEWTHILESAKKASGIK